MKLHASICLQIAGMGRALDINGNIYTRLMIEAPMVSENRTRLTGLHFLYFRIVNLRLNLGVPLKGRALYCKSSLRSGLFIAIPHALGRYDQRLLKQRFFSGAFTQL